VVCIFEVVVDSRVFREAKKRLKQAHIEKLSDFIEALKVDPCSPFPQGYDVRRIKSSEAPLYAVRFGKYRVMYGVDWDSKTIYVFKIKPRDSAYKR